MEIQDRNNLLQMLGAARDGKVQISSAEGNAFADILNSAKDVVSFPQNDYKGVELKQSARQIEVSDSVKDKVFNKKENSSEEVGVANKETSVSKKEDSKPKDKSKAEEDAPAQANQPDENKTKVDEENESTSDALGDKEVDVTNTDVEEDSDVVAEDIVEVESVIVSPVVQVPVFEDVLIQSESVFEQNNVPVEQKVQIVADTSIEEVYQATSKDEAKPLTQFVVEDVAVLSEEEKLLMEQAKYFDEKVASDKKLKIEVSVSEAKIAEPVIKDVLKNRFEVDSMFQVVDEKSDLSLIQEDAVFEDDIIIEKNTTVMPDIKNVAYNEVKVVQDVANTAVVKDATVMAVSGKEVVAEVANVSKNEAFVKINETVSRDTFKGMSKEVIEQIKVNITKSAVKGVDTIDIQLKPEDLGKLQIKMHIAKDGKVQAEIITSRAETADMLQKDASSLSKAFNDAGYDTDAKSFTFSYQNENQAKGQEKDDAGLLKFIGDTLEQEAEKVAGNDNSGYDPVLGLNIRV